MSRGLALLLSTSLIAGCTTSDPNRMDGSGRASLPNAYARSFQVFARGDARELIVQGPGGATDTAGHFLLVPHEVQAPAVPGATILRVPLERVAVLSTTHLSYLAALQQAGRVVGCAYLDQVMDPSVKEQLPLDVLQVAGGAGIDRELLIALAPDAVFDYPFGKGDDLGRGLSGMVVVPVTEYLEQHPLGRAEWLRYFGMLMGLEHEADSLFAAIRERYEALVKLEADMQHRPRVLFGSAWHGQWWLPGRDTYMSTLIADAGALPVTEGPPGRENVAIDLEALLDAARRSDHFGVLVATPDAVDARLLAGGDPRIASLPALQYGGFHGNSATADLFGKALLEPDILLQDLRCIFHPGNCSGHRFTYFQPLAQ